MAETAIVRVAQGSLRGKKVKTEAGATYYSFQAIPYAKPPVGPLRFKAPQPAESWDGIRDALKEGDVAPQPGFFNMTPYSGNEDCLFINVFTPKLPTNTATVLKPVMVYIHGGGFYIGSGNSEMHGPSRMMNTGEVVLVTMNYRLGALGFLSTGDEVVPGNNGLKDQVLALRWVQQNIAQFGGNPHNITIGGISAGGGSVHLHVLSPMSEGLFHRAIAQSGSALCPWAAEDPAVARTKAFRLGKALGCKTSDSNELLEFLMQVPAQELTEATDKVLKEAEKHPLPIFFKPVIEKEEHEDEVFLPDIPINLIRNGKFHKVPLIIGVTSREGKLILPDLVEHTSWYNYLTANWDPVLSEHLRFKKGTQEIKETSRKIQDFYFDDNILSKETWPQLFDVYGDILFNIWAYRSAKEQQSKSSASVYLYQLSSEVKRPEGKGSKLFPVDINIPGAGHGADLPYLFETADLIALEPLDDDSKEVSKKMLKMWINFAKTGNPTPGPDSLLGVTWSPVTKTGLNYLNIDKELTMHKDPMKKNMDFWDKILVSWK